MKILVLATKSPWPAIDGGRRLLAATLEAMAGRGHDLTLVFPAQPEDAQCPFAGCRVVPVVVERRSRLGDLLAAQLRARPLTLHRHDHPEVKAKVEELLAAESFDLVHAEQVQALAAAEPAFARGLPVVLRAQNLESELWRGLAKRRWWWWPLLALEAKRLAREEAKAVQRATTTIALSWRDAAGLTALSGKKVIELPAFSPAELPAGEKLPGEPALVLFGGGWPPNRDGAAFFMNEIWPRIAGDFPNARVHVFGDPEARGERVEGHPAPAESRQAFPQGGILLVPLFIGSGVRMKILESWARGLPAIATPVAARGLLAKNGQELEIATTPAEFAAAIQKLGRPEEAAKAVEAGRKLLRSQHDPESLARRLEEIYRVFSVAPGEPPPSLHSL
jgi:polysaccharide biosynthesis protein PslH